MKELLRAFAAVVDNLPGCLLYVDVVCPKGEECR